MAKHSNRSNFNQENHNTCKACTFSPYRKRIETTQQSLLAFTGKVMQDTDNFPCKSLLDGGCEELIISKSFSGKRGMTKRETNLKAELWDGILTPMEKSSKDLKARIKEATIIVRPYIVNWIAYDLILGKAWLWEANPLFNWKLNHILLQQGDRSITLDAQDGNHGDAHVTYMLSRKLFGSFVRKQRSPIYHVVLKLNNMDKTKEKTRMSGMNC